MAAVADRRYNWGLEAADTQEIFISGGEGSSQCLCGVAGAGGASAAQGAGVESQSRCEVAVRLCGADGARAGGAVCESSAGDQVIALREAVWGAAVAGAL